MSSEEHFRLGETLHATGALSLDGAPSLLRPPGYPAFVAGVLHVRDVLAPGLEGRRAVVLAQGVLSSLGALVLYLHAVRRVAPAIAAAIGVLAGFHPIVVLGTQALTYPALHVLALIVATLALVNGLPGGGPRLAWAAPAGVAWALATLVRPVSLVLPPFVLLAALWTGGVRSWRRAAAFTLVFTAAMAAAIAPWSARNHRRSGRLVVVNAQDGFALWGLAAAKNPGGDFMEWTRLWWNEGMPIYQRVTGEAAYRIETLNRHAVALNDALRADALRRIREDPAHFAGNVARNLVLFNRDTSYAWTDRLPFTRDGGWRVRAWLAKSLVVAVLLAGVVGVFRGLREGAAAARVLAVVYAMFCLAHAIGIVMDRYTYVRLPLVLLALPFAVPPGEPEDGRGARAFRWAAILAALLMVDLAIA